MVMKAIFASTLFLTASFYTAAVSINICLCHDLIYCLRDPMRNPEARYPYYAIFVIMIGFGTGLMNALSWHNYLYG